LIESPSISVVIPTFNRALLLSRALRSVVTQTLPADEIIVVDDGSSDGTLQILAEAYPSITKIRQANCGVSAARNRGIEAASGEWIAFLDSDDEWLPDKLMRQFSAVSVRPMPLVSHCDEIWIRRGVRVNPMNKHKKEGGWLFKKSIQLCAISPSSAFIHRTVFDGVGLFDEKLPACEDYDLWLRITSRFPVHYIGQNLVIKHGGHSDQLSSQYWGMDRFRIEALQKILACDHLQKDDWNAACKMLISKATIMANGARKRDKFLEAEKYEDLCRRYSQFV